MMKRLTKQDVLGLIELYSLGRSDSDREVINDVLDFLNRKFKQHTYEYRFEVNYGRDAESGSESISDGVS